jgi:hypothetical protein
MTFARVHGMSDSAADPSGNTEQFRAFAQQQPTAAPARSSVPLVAGIVGAVVLIALVAVVAVFLA